MTNETEITTPVETADVDTSSEMTAPATDTVVDEQPTEETAVTETQKESSQELLAGKYKTVEDLVKGYNEAQKFVTKANEFEKKYNELVTKQQEEVQKLTQQKLKEAQLRGFQTVEAQEIADQVQVAEFEYYWNNLMQLDPEHAQTVQQCLQAYYQSGHPSYLEEAKRYFPADFIERVAVEKSQLKNRLTNDLRMKQDKEYDARQLELAQTLKTNYAEFLKDLEQNSGKSQALQQFTNAGFINSQEDMNAFVDVYNAIAKFERETQLKEIEAQKNIDEIKSKAVIPTGNNTGVLSKGIPTYNDIKNMSQEEYNAAVNKYGLDMILNAK